MDVRHRASLITFISLSLVCVGIFLWMCAPFVMAVIMGEILALLLAPFHRWTSKRIPAKLSSAAATLGLFILVIAPIGFFVTATAKQGAEAAKQLVGDKPVREHAEDVADKAGKLVGDRQAATRQIQGALQQGAKKLSLGLLAVAGAIPGMALHLAMALLSCYFLLLDDGRLPARLLGKLPIDSDLKDILFETIRSTAVSTLWAGFIAAVSQSAVILLGFWMLGIPMVLLAAGATFICAWVPMLGVMPAGFAGLGYLLWQGDYPRLAAMAAVVGAAGLVDNFARAVVLKSGRGLDPLLSLVAIFGGVQLFGIVGLFAGPVIAAVVVALYDVWPKIAERYKITLAED